MSDHPPHQDLDALETRLSKARDKAGKSAPESKEKNQPQKSALSLAMRVGVELVSALAIGVAIGWLLDQWLGTRPWLMLVFIFIGGAAGILNVYRMARGFGYAAGYQKEDDSGNDEPPVEGSKD